MIIRCERCGRILISEKAIERRLGAGCYKKIKHKKLHKKLEEYK